MPDSSLFTPPKIFSEVNFHRHTDRTIGWLELFYDLVYVATLIQIGNFLSDNTTVTGFAQFMVMLTVVWWSWTGETFYQNRYVVDDFLHRVLVFIQMFAVASLGISVSGAFGDLYVQFTLAYVVIRLMLVLMYVRTMRDHPETAEFAQSYIIGFTIGIVVWLGSLLLPYEYHWIGWLVGIGFELAVPQLPGVKQRRQKVGADIHHISERFGIFTIIVLGKSFVKILDDSQGTLINAEAIAFSTVGLIVVYTLWWLYFSETAGKTINFSNNLGANLWVYGHLPLAAGLVAFGVGAKKLFAEAVTYGDKPVTPEYRILYMVSIVMYLIALAMIDLGLDDDDTVRNQARKALLHIISAVLIGIGGVLFVGLNAIEFVAFIAVIMAAQVAYDIYQTRRTLSQKAAQHGAHDESHAGA